MAVNKIVLVVITITTWGQIVTFIQTKIRRGIILLIIQVYHLIIR